MSQFELVSKTPINLKDLQTGKYTGKILKEGTPLCITLPDQFTAGTLFSSAKLNPIVLNAVSAKLGLPITSDQFSSSIWKILKSS